MFAPLADLYRHAAHNPDAVALRSPGLRYSFAQLAETVDAVASRLRTEGVTPRQVVALDLPSALEWIVDLALLKLATRSVSLSGVGDTGTLTVDVLITAEGARSVPATIVLRVDSEWVLQAVSGASGESPAVDYARPDSIFRLLLTSGTTGMPRAAAYSVAALEHRRQTLDRYWADGRVELNFMAMSTTGGFHTAVADLNHGQKHLAVDFINADTLRFAAGEGVQVLCGSPLQIASALSVLAAHSIALPDLEEIRMAGATPTATLLRLIAERLGVPVRSVYGSTEGGGVTARMVHPDDDLSDVGPALPGLELQVVDDNGTPVDPGTVGSVRYRGPGTTTGYYVNGAVEPFPSGWFAPGDTGSLDESGSLTLSGRSSEIVNVAGTKVDPARIDALALEFAGVRDAAAFGFERPDGIAELGLAVVAEPGCNLRELDRIMRESLKQGFPTTYWTVSEIPRNRMGKAERGTLAEAFAKR